MAEQSWARPISKLESNILYRISVQTIADSFSCLTFGIAEVTKWCLKILQFSRSIQSGLLTAWLYGKRSNKSLKNRRHLCVCNKTLILHSWPPVLTVNDFWPYSQLAFAASVFARDHQESRDYCKKKKKIGAILNLIENASSAAISESHMHHEARTSEDKRHFWKHFSRLNFYLTYL